MNIFETPEELRKFQMKLVGSWKTKIPGIFEHYKDSQHNQVLIAQLLENYEQRVRIKEADITNTVAGTTTTNFPAVFAWPMIVQVFPNLVANKIVNVTPMNGPVGLIFYRHFEYSTSYNGQNVGSFQHSGSYALSSEVPPSIQRGRVVFKSYPVQAISMKLRAQWSSEVAEDARVIANFDMETDMLEGLRDEILGEIDSLVLQDLVLTADLNGVVNAGNVNFDPTTPHSYEGLRLHREEIIDALIDADKDVYLQRFASTDYIVGHPNSIGYLQKLQMFVPVNVLSDGGGSIGARNVGQLQGRWDVYSSPHMPSTNVLLVGVKGVGYTFSPYIPLELTPAVYLYDSDETTRGMRTRFAKLKTDGMYFATLTLTAGA